MTKEEMISAIYENVADKTLTFGCRITHIRQHSNEGVVIRIIQNYHERSWGIYLFRLYDNWIFTESFITKHQITTLDIIWHPVMIWDVLDFISKDILNKKRWLVSNWWIDETYWVYDETLFDLWEYKRKSVEAQSDKCIEYVYNLIK